MKLIIIASAMLAFSAQAQVYKCPGPDGKTVYSDAPCPAGQRMDAGKLQGNTVQAQPTPAQEQLPAPAAAAKAARTSCLSERQVKNLETSASSIHLKPIDRQVMLVDIDRAKACQPLMSEAEKSNLKAEYQAAARANRPPPLQVISNCDAGGCWGSNGTRYTKTATGFTRQDGAQCRTEGNMMRCN